MAKVDHLTDPRAELTGDKVGDHSISVTLTNTSLKSEVIIFPPWESYTLHVEVFDEYRRPVELESDYVAGMPLLGEPDGVLKSFGQGESMQAQFSFRSAMQGYRYEAEIRFARVIYSGNAAWAIEDADYDWQDLRVSTELIPMSLNPRPDPDGD